MDAPQVAPRSTFGNSLTPQAVVLIPNYAYDFWVLCHSSYFTLRLLGVLGYSTT